MNLSRYKGRIELVVTILLVVISLWLKCDTVRWRILDLYTLTRPYDVAGIEGAIADVGFDPMARDSAPFPGPFFVVREIGASGEGEVEPYPVHLLPNAIWRRRTVTGSFADAGTVVVFAQAPLYEPAVQTSYDGVIAMVCFIDMGNPHRRHVESLYRTRPYFSSQRCPHAWLWPPGSGPVDIPASDVRRRKEEFRRVGGVIDYIAARQRAGGTRDIHLAARMGNAEALKRLLDGGVDPNLRDDFGVTPLHCAASENREAAVAMLLAAGAEASAADQGATTPLHLAAGGGHRRVVEMLLDADAQVDAPDDRGSRPLHDAVYECRTGVVSLLINRGADVNARRVSGTTALHLATRSETRELAEMLVAAGAVVDARADDGTTPLHYLAQSSDCIATAGLLIAHGAGVQAVDERGLTPLHYACEWGREDLAMYLISRGARNDMRDAEGNMPSALAANHGFYNLAQAVRDGNAGASSTDSHAVGRVAY
jgi:ankyrin repeat protein